MPKSDVGCHQNHFFCALRYMYVCILHPIANSIHTYRFVVPNIDIHRSPWKLRLGTGSQKYLGVLGPNL